MWDFLTPLEARQVLDLQIEDPENSKYDAHGINQEYISGSDVVVLVYDVKRPHTFLWCKRQAKLLI